MNPKWLKLNYRHNMFSKRARFLFAVLPFITVFFSQPVLAADKSLVLLPLVIYSDQPKDYLRPGLNSMFVSRLSGEGLQLIGDEKLSPLLSEKEKQGVNSKPRAEEIARALKADFAVFGSLTSIGPGFSLDLSVLELGNDESKVTRISVAVPEDQLIPKLSDMVYYTEVKSSWRVSWVTYQWKSIFSWELAVLMG